MNILVGRAILLGGLLASLVSNPGALAQSYPSRTVTIVVTSAAGALTDVLTRAVSQRLSQIWGQSIVVENRGGAGHNFAATAVKAAAADGYTLLSSETGFATSQPHLRYRFRWHRTSVLSRRTRSTSAAVRHPCSSRGKWNRSLRPAATRSASPRTPKLRSRPIPKASIQAG